MSSGSLHATATAKLTARKEGKANPRLDNLFFWFTVIQVKRNDGESQDPRLRVWFYDCGDFFWGGLRR